MDESRREKVSGIHQPLRSIRCRRAVEERPSVRPSPLCGQSQDGQDQNAPRSQGAEHVRHLEGVSTDTRQTRRIESQVNDVTPRCQILDGNETKKHPLYRISCAAVRFPICSNRRPTSGKGPTHRWPLGSLKGVLPPPSKQILWIKLWCHPRSPKYGPTYKGKCDHFTPRYYCI